MAVKGHHAAFECFYSFLNNMCHVLPTIAVISVITLSSLPDWSSWKARTILVHSKSPGQDPEIGDRD
jgi:hypothetical protein